jgi:signal recognition particle receptor subunit beta
MAIFNYAAREMTAKIVYYGPGLSGKTTSIQFIHTRISAKNKGKLVSLATETDRTLFFDFFPVEFGQIGGFKVKFNFYTVPGQVFYNTTRKLVLKGADGVVFVADSQPGMMEQNIESLNNLKENLRAHGIDVDTVPFVIQYNKRDIPGAQAVEEMRRLLNQPGVPDFETCATSGEGVMEAMKAICRMVLEEIQKKQRGAAPKAAGPRPAVTQEEGQPSGANGEPEPRSSAAPAAAAPGRAPGIERTTTLSLRGPGSHAITIGVPLELQLEAGVEGVQVSVEVRVTYQGGRGQVLVRDLSGESRPPHPAEAPAAPAKKAGFFARLFGKE